MDADKIVKVKPQDKLASQPVARPKPKSEIEAQPLQSLEPVVRSPQESESVEQLTSNPEPVDHSEPLATIQRADSIFGSGWEYSQLLKEFRD